MSSMISLKLIQSLIPPQTLLTISKNHLVTLTSYVNCKPKQKTKQSLTTTAALKTLSDSKLIAPANGMAKQML